MKLIFYPKLAWEGIRKNKRMYLPYLLTGTIMVMMYYILSFLRESPALLQMRGGSILQSTLPLGCWIIAFFSLLFLFYTNSFLIRQRYREFGLYNTLGMDKNNISKLMLWESLYIAVFAIVSGLILGIALSKAAELILLNLLHKEITFTISLGKNALCQTPVIFGGIYLILLLNSIRRVRRMNPLALLKSSKVGEKIPKRTWLYALIGLLFLGAAYFLAIRIKNPLAALSVFFLAVLFVIVGTYLLFISGSVALCRLLQKNKAYYYKPNHFISVSSMIYRMKRNGAGLASICILLTMVLVMLSSTASMYIGHEDMLRTRYPYGVNITTYYDDVKEINTASIAKLKNTIQNICGADIPLTDFRIVEIPGCFTEEGILLNPEVFYETSTVLNYDMVGYLSILSLEDYNRLSDSKETLAADECLIYNERIPYHWETFSTEYGKTYSVKKELTDFITKQTPDSLVVPVVYMVVDDISAFTEPLSHLANQLGDPLLQFQWRCGFDLETTKQELAIEPSIRNALAAANAEPCRVEIRESNRISLFDMNGSLLFLGTMLSLVFLLAAVLIIYYKQISEGYEDQARFDIMQKVGMTKEDIRKSINSQMLTVFFSPMIFAGIHLCFAFPFLWKILKMFSLNNLPLLMTVTACCYICFSLLYTLVYKITSNAYYTIVSGSKKE